jgi:UDP-N-acetylmuramate dehydrogenase
MMDKKLTEKLNAAVSGKVLFDEPMSDHTSIGVGGKVDAFIYPGNSMDVVRAVTFLTEHGIPFLPVGNCTNLIVKDGGYRGCLISLRELQAIEITQEVDERAYLYAEAGVPLSRIVDISIRESLEGLEFCAGIPGTVGGGVRMNAGAYGMEMKDTVRSISLINGSAEAKKINKEDLHFEYRNLALPKGALITGAEFSLSKGRKEGNSCRYYKCTQGKTSA